MYASHVIYIKISDLKISLFYSSLQTQIRFKISKTQNTTVRAEKAEKAEK